MKEDAGLPISPPIVLCVAASDCCAGAGIQADLKTISACGAYGLTVVTGVVAQTPHRVLSWAANSAQSVADQLHCVKEYPVAAVKTGLLFNEEQVEQVAALCEEINSPLVIDPVGSASAGAKFVSKKTRQFLEDRLFPLATLITPNLMEGRSLCEQPAAGALEVAKELAQKFRCPFLVKGGHSGDPESSTDYYCDPTLQVPQAYRAERLQVPDLHGTGCTLASAVAASLSRGQALSVAIQEAKTYMTETLRQYERWLGQGDPFYALQHFPRTDSASG